MQPLDMNDIEEFLTELSTKVKNAKSLGEEIDAWAEWCKMWDSKETLEEALREEASIHEL